MTESQTLSDNLQKTLQLSSRFPGGKLAVDVHDFRECQTLCQGSQPTDIQEYHIGTKQQYVRGHLQAVTQLVIFIPFLPTQKKLKLLGKNKVYSAAIF